MHMRHRLLAVVLLVTAGGGFAHAEQPWDTAKTTPYVIKTRSRAGTAVKEIWAEGDLQAGVQEIQSTVTDMTRFSKFMPYIAEARQLGNAEPDGSFYGYTRLDLPFLSSRDFIHKTYIDRDATKDPEGVFASHWFAVPDRIPQRMGMVRLRISEGSWLVTPLPGGKSHAVYKFAADPAGNIPSFAVNASNTDSVVETFRNVEKEAQRRAAEHKVQASKP